MAELAYGEVYAMNKAKATVHLIETYAKTGAISETARCWGTSRQASAPDFVEPSA